MDVFSALAEPTRRNIIEMLAVKGQLSATDISDKLLNEMKRGGTK